MKESKSLELYKMFLETVDEILYVNKSNLLKIWQGLTFKSNSKMSIFITTFREFVENLKHADHSFGCGKDKPAGTVYF